jgi:hypothetical protein
MHIRTLCLALLSLASVVQAVSPNPLENAYWRFEEGVAGNPVDPPQTDVVLDSLNENHMRTYAAADPDTRPRYTNDVPVSVVPQTGQPNTLALHFTPNQDIWSDGKNINNPIVTNGFTLEAAFKPETVTAFQGIVGKDGQPTARLEQTLVLKVRGDTGELQIELFDHSGAIHGVRSLTPLVPNQWYYAAVVDDGTQLSLYLDRNDGAGYVLQGTDPTPLDGALWEGTVPEDGFDTAWAIGRGMYANGVTDWFSGVIDEVRITNRVLDPTEFLFYQSAAKGDLNRDGKVDREDLRLFILCTTGPAVPFDPQAPPAGCEVAPGAWEPDFDTDGDIDQDDFGVLQANYTG